jgi:hypothetical protein
MRLGVPDSSLCAQSQLPRIVSLVKSSFVFPLVRWAAKVALSRRLRPSGRQRRIPEPQRYAKLRAKARAGTRPINHGEPPERPHFFLFRPNTGRPRRITTRQGAGDSPNQTARGALIDEKMFAFNYELSPNSR